LTERKAFLLRLDPALHDALQRWAGAELRSLNAQIEYLLRKSLSDAGRLPEQREQPTGNRQQEGQG
jgi:hypothetical protein